MARVMYISKMPDKRSISILKSDLICGATLINTLESLVLGSR